VGTGIDNSGDLAR